MSIYAPYNFVPFAERPLRRYESPDDLPPHDVWDAKLLSGEIRVSVTAKTPVYIGNGGKKTEADFFRTVKGEYAIPGSTLRGLVRENMQILGFGRLREGEDYGDYRVLFRRMADAKGTLGADLRKQYQAILGSQNKPPMEVKGGFLRCDGPDQYSILPVKTFYLAKKNLAGHEKWAELTATVVRPIWFRQIGTSEFGEPMAELSAVGGEGWRKGTLHCVGEMKGQNTLYVFPEPAEDAERIRLTEQDIVAYREDYEARKNSLSGTNRRHRMDKSFWALPKVGESKPVFYFRCDGFTSFGMSRYLRIAYNTGIRAGLPAAHQAPAEDLFLDYPYAILGYAGKKDSYRSRVSFGDLPADRDLKNLPLLKTQLGEPKISFFPGYSVGGKHYNAADGYRFRGFKQYWLKETEKKQDPVAPDERLPDFASVMRPLPAGTRFSGSIRYRNLHPDELGLLLWCLVLDKGCQQNVGMGKPYGYGRVEIKIESLWEQDPGALYGSGNLTAMPRSLEGEAAGARVEALIRAYTESDRIRERGKKGIRQIPTVRDFLGMKQTLIPAEASGRFEYMPLSAFKGIQEALPTARDLLSELQKSTPANSPASGAPEKLGDVVRCVVTGDNRFGISVRLPSGQTGTIRQKDLTLPLNKIRKGMTLKAELTEDRFGVLFLSCKIKGGR